MLIRVKYVDERFDMVRPDILDRLLESGKVREFQRKDGWVVPGIGSLRSKNSLGEYSGIDRRKKNAGERGAPV
ncbi:MAG: GSU3473 family protein [Desulfuromonadaceae bacterium]